MSRKPNRVQLGVERLEDRAVPAGDVVARVIDGDLDITGDYQSNVISLTAGYHGEVVVQGHYGTKVNGEDFAVLRNVRRNFEFYMGGGNDWVTLQTVDVPRQLNAQMGKGNDWIFCNNAHVWGKTELSMADGQNLFAAWGSGEFRKDFEVRATGNVQIGIGSTSFLAAANFLNVGPPDVGTPSRASINLEQSSFNGPVHLQMTAAADTAAIDGVTFKGPVSIGTGPGADVLGIQNSFFAGNASIAMSGGSDSLTLLGNRFEREVSINAGASSHNDVVRIGLSNQYSHNTFGLGLSVLTGRGNDLLSIHSADIYDGVTQGHWPRKAHFDLGEGDDTLGLQDMSVLFADVEILMGDGDDRVDLFSTFYDDVLVVGGDGTDSLDVTGSYFVKDYQQRGFEP